MPIKDDWIEFKKENIRALPLNLIGVYECGYKRGNIVVYIGKGIIRDRLLDHKEKASFLGITHFRKRKTSSISAAEDAEARLIEQFRKLHNGNPPKLNTNIPKLKKSDDWFSW